MLKISNKTFYYRHKQEIEKYLENKNSLHILNVSSKNKLISTKNQKIFLDPSTSNNVPILEKNKKYERIIITDILENHDDMYTFLSEVTNALTDDGKLVISSINSKYSLFFKVFELLKIKDSNKNNSYIHLKKIQNITNGVGLEYQKYYTIQFLPF
jgi:2-polyprenyl-3-methyl-5-hydroxy-6-metoxy-1,4-benzoquinol methylase